MISKLTSAQSFAVKIHSNKTKKDGTKITDHLQDVVSKLMNLGITDKEILSAAWLHDVLEDGETAPAELKKLFGKNITSIVLSLTKSHSLSKKHQDVQYMKKLKRATMDAKLIKLCDIASNLEKIHASNLSTAYKTKTIRRLAGYFLIIKGQILKMQATYPPIKKIISNINHILEIYKIQ